MLSSSPIFISPNLSIKSNPSTTIPPRLRYRRHLATTAKTKTASSHASPNHLRPRGMTPCASLYEILGIPVGATCQEIKSAYRRLVRIRHPDVVAIERKETSADEFMKIHTAYNTLSDPAKRAVYDQKILRRSRPLTGATAGYSGYRGRNWETDQCW